MIEFTDRYGERAPSWLRGCHGDCEAMGWVPEEAHLEAEACSVFGAECDGWHFVQCLDCNGTGRVSWWITALRIPRWAWRGVRFYRAAMRRDISPPDWTWRRRFGNYLNASFIADLRRLGN